MRIILASLVIPLLFTMAGFGWISRCRAFVRTPKIERMAYAFLLGVTMVTLSLFGLSFFLHVELTALTTVLVVGISVAVSGLAWLTRKTTPPRVATTRVEQGWLLLVAVVGIGVILLSVVRPPAGWDFRMTWSAHARYFHEAQTVLPDSFLNQDIFVIHPRYPPLTSLMQVVTYHFGGAEEDCLVGPLYATFWVVLIVILFGGVRRLTHSIEAAIVVASIPIAVPWFLFGEGGALSGYADLPLACFFGAAVVQGTMSDHSVGAGWFAGIWLAAGLFTKNEGAALALVYVLSALVFWLTLKSNRRVFAKETGATIAVLLVAGTPLVLWASQIPQRHSEDYISLLKTGALLRVGMGVLVTDVIPAVIQIAAKPPWIVLILPMLLFLWLGRHALTRQRSVFLTASWVLGNVAYGSAYAMEPWVENMNRMVTVTWERLQLQISVPLLILLGVAVSSVLNREREEESDF